VDELIVFGSHCSCAQLAVGHCRLTLPRLSRSNLGSINEPVTGASKQGVDPTALWIHALADFEFGGREMITRRVSIAIAVLVGVFAASCGKPKASGIYVYQGDNEVALVQLVETKDGGVTGRFESVTVDSQGNVGDQSVSLDGATSGHDLVLKPTSVWLGGVSATGSFDRGGLTLASQGFSLKAERSSLLEYQAAVTQLRGNAAKIRQRISAARREQATRDAQARREQAARGAEVQANRDAAFKASQLEDAAVEIRRATEKLNKTLALAPDFGRAASVNTAKISRMAQTAPTLSVADRNRIVAAANQIVIDTNQIEFARSQYVFQLNQHLWQAAPLADRVEQYCGSAQGRGFAECRVAIAAASDFKGVVARGVRTFGGHKQVVQSELARQSSLIGRMHVP
jgi:hypothetical protein